MKPKSQVCVLFAVIIAFIGFLLWGLGNALLPLFLAFFLTYLLFPLIIKLEKKGIKRTLAISTVFVGSSLLIILILVLMIPGLIRDGREFVQELPDNTQRAIIKVESIASDYGLELDLSKDGLTDLIEENLSLFSGDTLKSATKAIGGVFKNFMNLVLFILNIFLIPLFFFYVASDYENITKGIKSFIPKAMLPTLNDYTQKANTVFSGYIRGQMMVAAILGLLYGIGLSLVKLKFGFLIGLMAGALSIIPYVGFSVGFLTAIMVALANHSGMGTYGGIIIVFGLVQTLEGIAITPKLVGDKVGLSALATMLALIIGGNVLGLPGMLLAIPTAAIIKLLLLDLRGEIESMESISEIR